MIRLTRNPIFIQFYQLLHSLHKNFFRHLWHLHSFCRNIKPPEIIFRTKNESFALVIFIGFYSFKNGLAVMNRCTSRINSNGLIWFNFHCSPLAVFVIHFKHVIGKIFTEGKIIYIQSRQLDVLNFCDFKIICSNHNLYICCKETKKTKEKIFMSLDNIQLSTQTCEILFSHNLIGDQASKPKAQTQEKIKIECLGENKKQVVFIVNDPSSKFLADEEMEMLTKLVSACKMTMKDIALVNFT